MTMRWPIMVDERCASSMAYLVQSPNIRWRSPQVVAEIRDIHAEIGPPAIPYACRVCDRPVSLGFEFGALFPDILCVRCREWAEAYHLGIRPAWARYWRRKLHEAFAAADRAYPVPLIVGITVPPEWS